MLDSLLDEYKDVFDRNYKEAGWSISKWWVTHIRKPDSTYEANYSFLKNWCAERNAWMTEHFKPFGETYIVGDADESGDVTITDVTMVQRIIAGIDTEDGTVTMRCNIKGTVLDANDALQIQKYIAKYRNENNIGYQLRY